MKFFRLSVLVFVFLFAKESNAAYSVSPLNIFPTKSKASSIVYVANGEEKKQYFEVSVLEVKPLRNQLTNIFPDIMTKLSETPPPPNTKRYTFENKPQDYNFSISRWRFSVRPKSKKLLKIRLKDTNKSTYSFINITNAVGRNLTSKIGEGTATLTATTYFSNSITAFYNTDPDAISIKKIGNNEFEISNSSNSPQGFIVGCIDRKEKKSHLVYIIPSQKTLTYSMPLDKCKIKGFKQLTKHKNIIWEN